MIQLKEVNKEFDGKRVLNGLNLDISSSEIYALVGSNGAGKTTTLNLIMGFIKAEQGEVLVNGLNPTTQTHEVREMLAYIPENVSLYPYLTGFENLDYFSKLGGMKYDKEKLEQLLVTSGLQKDSVHNKVSTYSKGMRQKVGIGIALAKNAGILLLDEPASGLDPKASNELSATMKNLALKGKTILMASHDLFRVRETATRIGMLHNGELLKELDPNSITANDLETMYLNYMKN